MSSVIKIKRSDTSGSVPSGLEVGEIAVNLFDRKLYVGNTASGVSTIGGEDFRLTSQDAGEGAYVRLIGDQAPSANNVLLRGGSAITVGRDSNGSISVAHDGTLQTVAVERAALANTNAYIAAVQADVDANEATERAALANTNSYIATESARIDLVNTNLTSTNTAIRTLVNNNLANTNAEIDNLNTNLTSTNTTIRTLVSDRMQVANTQSLVNARLGATASVTLSGDVTGTASFSANAVTISTTIAADSVALGTDTTGNYVATVTGTSNEIEVSGSGSETAAVTIGLPNDVTIGNDLTVTNDLTVSNDASIAGNLTVDGNLTVEGGTTYLSTSTVYTDDGMFKMSANNAGDATDTGIYAKYVVSGNSAVQYAGYFRDATDGVFKFYKGLDVEPAATVDTTDTGYGLAQVDAIIDGGTY